MIYVDIAKAFDDNTAHMLASNYAMREYVTGAYLLVI